MRILGFCLLFGGFLWLFWIELFAAGGASHIVGSHGAGAAQLLNLAPEVTTFTRKEVEETAELVADRVAQNIFYRRERIMPAALAVVAGGLVLAYAKRRQSKPAVDEHDQSKGGGAEPKSLARFMSFRRNSPTPNPALQRTSGGRWHHFR